MIKKSYIISIVVIVSFLGISATWVISKANESINELPAVIKKVPEFSMTSHIGESFNQDSLLNKISIIDLITQSIYQNSIQYGEASRCNICFSSIFYAI